MKKLILFLIVGTFFISFCEFKSSTDEDDDDGNDDETIECSVTVSGDIDKEVESDGKSVQFPQLTSPEGENRLVQCYDQDDTYPRISIFIDEWYSATSQYDMTAGGNELRYRTNDSTQYTSDSSSTDCVVTFTTSLTGTFRCTNMSVGGVGSINLSDGAF